MEKNKKDEIDFEIKEGNGKGKEYNNDGNLEFEGEYLKGKRKEIKKEYYFDDKLKFEEKYLNVEKNGIGKEYKNDDKVKFEGEYLNGKRWNGIGKEYKYNGKLRLKSIGKRKKEMNKVKFFKLKKYFNEFYRK